MAKLTPRKINGIRCFTCEDFRQDQIINRCDFEEFFPNDFHLDYIAERCFLKLRELNFQLFGFSEIHICFFPSLKEGPVHSSSDGVHLWKRDVYVGLNAKQWQHFNDVEKEKKLISLIAECCRYLASEKQMSIIGNAELALKENGENLEIQIFEKDMKTYNFRVTCKVPSKLQKIESKAHFANKRTGMSYEAEFVQVLHVPDLTLLCGTVSFKAGEIVVSPRKHYWASDFYIKYGTPIRLKVADMDVVL